MSETEAEAEALEALEELGEEELVEITPDISIPSPPVLSIPTDLAADYLERILEYRFYNHLYPVPKMERAEERIMTQADSREVVREVYNKLTEFGWHTDINATKDVPVITGSKDKSRLALGVLENEENTIIVISSTSALRNEAVNAITSLKEIVKILKTAPRKRPKTKPILKEAKVDEELPELPTPPPRPSIIAEDKVQPEIKALEEPTIVEPEEIEAEQKTSKEQEQERITKEIQKFQKYLRSLHEYYELGRMTEDEYIFLKRKTFEKIEQLRRSLID